MRPLRALVLLSAVACTATPRPRWDLPQASRVVAVGDVHGSLEGFVAILRAAKLLDDADRWDGGTTVLVQTGDLLDRGTHVRGVLDLLMRLESEAAAAGGAVIVLWGNHEVLNLTVDTEDVSKAALGTFMDGKGEERRRRALARWQASFPELPSPEEEAAWHRRHPPGIFAYVEALGPEGIYGRWLRRRPVVARVGATLFIHGGISPAYASLSPKEINERGHNALADLDRHRAYLIRRRLASPTTRREWVVAYAQRAFRTLPRERQKELVGRTERVLKALRALLEGGELFARDAPVWYRGFAEASEEELAYLPAYLDAQGVHRIVAGHTPQKRGEVQMRLTGRLFLIDTGMQWLVYEGGRPAALEIVGDRVTAIYTNERRVLVEGSRRSVPPILNRSVSGGHGPSRSLRGSPN